MTDDNEERARGDRMSALLEDVEELVRRHGEPIIREWVMNELKDISLNPDEIEAYADALEEELTDAGVAREDIEGALAEVRERLAGTASDSDEDALRVCNAAVEVGCESIVLGWVNALIEGASRQGGMAWLRLSMLGDDMLPKGDDDATEMFERHFSDESPIDADLGRAVLRAVRASLPPGQVLPEKMKEALDAACGIVLVSA